MDDIKEDLKDCGIALASIFVGLLVTRDIFFVFLISFVLFMSYAAYPLIKQEH